MLSIRTVLIAMVVTTSGAAHASRPGSVAPTDLIPSHRVVLADGETVSQALRRVGVSREEISPIVVGLGRLRSDPREAARELTIKVDRRGRLLWFNYRATSNILFRVERSSKGRWSLGALELPIETLPLLVTGARGPSLESALAAQKEEPQLAVMVRDLLPDAAGAGAPEDRFRILIEKRFVDTDFVEYGRVLAAELERGGRLVRAFYFAAHEDAPGGYYDEAGTPLSVLSSAAPIEGARRTSPFGSRDHPVFGHPCTHLGVDYGSPAGTPVRAVRDGQVERASRDGQLGNLVTLVHSELLTTRYAHLERFARGMRKGKRVRQGDIIGYVGSTGLATGPHLHFEARVRDRYVDPDLVLVAVAPPLSPEQRSAFATHVARLKDALARAVTLAER